ncbi:MAG: hypothetical protein Q7U86_11320 [Draconibacterium sp.]|nr:hypothetical protein [Draconibacterium sp.]
MFLITFVVLGMVFMPFNWKSEFFPRDPIAVDAKITKSGHQVELKLYEHHFYKADWEEFDKLIEAA